VSATKHHQCLFCLIECLLGSRSGRQRICPRRDLFLDHRRRRAPETRRHYRHWFTEWRDWRIAHTLQDEIAGVQISDFRLFIRYLEDEHIPHGGNPHRRPANRRGLMPASVAAAHRTLCSFWIFLDNEELLTARQARFFTNNRIPAPEAGHRLALPRNFAPQQWWTDDNRQRAVSDQATCE
jgi:hypothetical protein